MTTQDFPISIFSEFFTGFFGSLLQALNFENKFFNLIGEGLFCRYESYDLYIGEKKLSLFYEKIK